MVIAKRIRLVVSVVAIVALGVFVAQAYLAVRNAEIEKRDTRSAAQVLTAHRVLADNFYKPLNSADLLNAALYGSFSALTEQGVPCGSIDTISSEEVLDAELEFVNEYARLTQLATDYGFDRQELAHEACRAMASSLHSSHTNFFPPIDIYDDGSWSVFLGVGAVLNQVDDQFFFLPVIEREPAHVAGIRNMDRLLEVDGVPVGVTKLEAVKAAICGHYEGSVKLTIERRGRRIEEPFVVARGMLGYSTCASSSALLAEGKVVNYIYLRDFEWDICHCMARDLRRCLQRFAADGVVLDLRGNHGGRADMLRWSLGLFYEEPTLIARNLKQKRSYLWRTSDGARQGESATNSPLVVLINEWSGSAAEVFAETIKQTRRGAVVGVRSRGVVEASQRFELPDHSCNPQKPRHNVLVIATGQIVTPNGAVLEGVGVMPDVVVPITKDDILRGRDSQLEAALVEIGKLMKK